MAIMTQQAATYGLSRSPMLRAGSACQDARSEGGRRAAATHRAAFHSRPRKPVRYGSSSCAPRAGSVA